VTVNSKEFVNHPGSLPRLTLTPSTASLSPRSAAARKRSQISFNAISGIVPLGELKPLSLSWYFNDFLTLPLRNVHLEFFVYHYSAQLPKPFSSQSARVCLRAFEP